MKLVGTSTVTELRHESIIKVVLSGNSCGVRLLVVAAGAGARKATTPLTATCPPDHRHSQFISRPRTCHQAGNCLRGARPPSWKFIWPRQNYFIPPKAARRFPVFPGDCARDTAAAITAVAAPSK